MSPVTVVSFLWLLWLISWVLAAAWTGKTVARQPLGERFLHGALTWVGCWLLFFHRASRGLGRPLFTSALWVQWVCVALALIGFTFAWWARIHLGRLWSGNVTLKEGHTIVRSGPYALTRHPIYSGLLLALTATAIVRSEVGAVLGWPLVVAGLVLKSRQEERLLITQFGEDYRDYQAEVRALIPGIW